MPVLTMSPTLGDVLKYELNPNVQREKVTIKQSAALALGTVLGKLTKDTVAVAAGGSNDRPPVSGPVGMLVERGLLDQRCAGRPSARQRGW